MHYLDNAATTAVSPEVAAVITEAMTRWFGNPSSLYRIGMESEEKIEEARTAVAASLGCAPKELYFTSCGSESNNIALQGAVNARAAWGKKIVCTGFEHPSVFKELARYGEQGWEVVFIAPRGDGTLDADALVDAVDEKTALAAFMQVNNEVGTIQPVVEMAARIREKNRRTAIHVDGVQGYGRLPVRLAGTAIDSYSLSGHKIHTPKGIGGLYLRQGFHLEPPYLGGGQERGVRPGTENIPYILGLAEASRAFAGKEEERYAAVAALNARLRRGLAAFSDVVINSPDDAIAHVLNFSVLGMRSEPLLHYLEEREIYVSSGSACSKGAASHTLVAMNLPAPRIDGAVRVSFTYENTAEDVDALLEGLSDARKTLARV